MKRSFLTGASLFALCLSCGFAKAGPVDFSYTGALESYVIPMTGTYDVTATGAQGGVDVGSRIGIITGDGGAGRGAQVSGDFTLTKGETLLIDVGGAGGYGGFNFGGGGGGGSFVTGPGSQSLVVAGGGGGGGGFSSLNRDASAGTNGLTPGPMTGLNRGGAGGTGGLGGTGGYEGGGGGGGLKGAGGNGTGFSGTGGFGGGGFPGLAGGLPVGGTPGPGGAYVGGFGGGGGGGDFGGGGGGGYSGGGGGGGGTSQTGAVYTSGGGGGSFDAGFNPTFSLADSRDGLVTINDLTPVTPVPEPASLLVLGTGLLGLAAAKRSRQ